MSPEVKLLEVFVLDQLDHGTYRLVGSWAEHAHVTAPPFAALELALAQLWLSD